MTQSLQMVSSGIPSLVTLLAQAAVFSTLVNTTTNAQLDILEQSF